jgi:hypothetical protein
MAIVTGTVTSHANHDAPDHAFIEAATPFAAVPGHRAGDPGGNDVCRLRVLPGADGGA